MISKLLTKLLHAEDQFPHGLGCNCAECAERRKQRDFDVSARIAAGAPPKTLVEILVAERKRQEKMQ